MSTQLVVDFGLDFALSYPENTHPFLVFFFFFLFWRNYLSTTLCDPNGPANEDVLNDEQVL